MNSILAEIEFGDKSEIVSKPKQRKSIFKRSAEDEEPSDEKLTFLGKKRKRPNSFSSTSNPNSPIGSPKPTPGSPRSSNSLGPIIEQKLQKPEKFQPENKRPKLTKTPSNKMADTKQKKQTPGKKNTPAPTSKVAKVTSTNVPQETRLTRRSLKSPQVANSESKITRRTRQNSIKEVQAEQQKHDEVQPSTTEVLPVTLTPTIVEKPPSKTKSTNGKEKKENITGETEKMDSSEGKIEGTSKKIEELTSEEMHRRERELEEAKKKIELESERIRNEREKRHEARQNG